MLTLKAIDTIGAAVGDHVEIDMPEGSVILSSFLVFIMPLIAFFTGYLIYGLILGFVFLAVYLIFLFIYDRTKAILPRIIRVLSSP